MTEGILDCGISSRVPKRRNTLFFEVSIVKIGLECGDFQMKCGLIYVSSNYYLGCNGEEGNRVLRQEKNNGDAAPGVTPRLRKRVIPNYRGIWKYSSDNFPCQEGGEGNSLEAGSKGCK